MHLIMQDIPPFDNQEKTLAFTLLQKNSGMDYKYDSDRYATFRIKCKL